jgi:hypothetical protein
LDAVSSKNLTGVSGPIPAGSFAEVDFPAADWSVGTDTTFQTDIVFASGQQGTFKFSKGRRILDAIDVGNYAGTQVTGGLRDDDGQVLPFQVDPSTPTQKTFTLVTNWQRCSGQVTIECSAGNKLRIRRISYYKPN